MLFIPWPRKRSRPARLHAAFHPRRAAPNVQLPRTARNRAKPKLELLEQRITPNTTLALSGTALTIDVSQGDRAIIEIIPGQSPTGLSFQLGIEDTAGSIVDNTAGAGPLFFRAQGKLTLTNDLAAGISSDIRQITVTGPGTVAQGGANDFLPSWSLTVDDSGGSAGTFDLNGFDLAIGALQGDGVITNSIASSTATLTVTGGGSFSGAIQDTGAGPAAGVVALTVAGAGQTLMLLGTNSYSGPTALNSGVFLVDGVQTASAITVQSGAFLGGNGAAGPITATGGGVGAVTPADPSSASGTLSGTSADFSNNGNLTIRVSRGPGGLSSNMLNLSGILTLGGSSHLTLDVGGLTPAAHGTITIIEHGGSTGQFGDVRLVNNPFNLRPIVTYAANAVMVTFAAQPFVFDDSADSANATYIITASTVQVNGSAPISYAGSSNLIIKGGSGADVYDVEATADTSPVTLITGTGANIVNVTPTIQDLGGLGSALTVQGGGGPTSLMLNDQADPNTSNSYTITSSSVASLLTAPIVFTNLAGWGASGMAGIVLNGERNASIYNVLSTGAGVPVVLNGGAGNDTFNVGSRAGTLDDIQGSVEVHAQQGSGALLLLDQNQSAGNTYTLTPTSVMRAGVAPIRFDAMQSVTIAAGSGDDTLAVTAPGAHAIFNGGGGTNTVMGPGASNTWALTGLNSGTLGNLAFSSTQNLVGGSVSDTFQVKPGGSVTGVIDGGTGVATLDYSQYVRGVTVNLANAMAPGAGKVTHISSVIGTPGNDTLTGNLHAGTTLYGDGGADKLQSGGDGNDTFILAIFQKTGTVVTGGTAIDTLVGPDLDNRWSLRQANAGSLSFLDPVRRRVVHVDFSGIANLTGGGKDDTFQFTGSGQATGVIDGGAGSNTLDFSALKSSVTINLQTKAATAVGGFTNIQSLVGNGKAATLVGANADNTWTFTGNDAGSLAGLVFTAIANVTGGTGPDVFDLSRHGVAGVIDGGAGVNALDYSGFKGSLLVDLPLGQASLSGGVKNIQNVTGGDGASVLVGDGNYNTLTGGKGRNILIAGSAAATLIGNADQDILVGGTTSFDTKLSALSALMAEWSRTDLSYAARVNHLLHGGGLNGADVLNGSTFQPNAGGNTLSGRAGLDLFFDDQALDTYDWNAGLGEIFVKGR